MRVGFRVLLALEFVLIIGTAIYLRSVPYFDKLGGMGEPICVADKHRFTSDICDECGKTIINNGIFASKSNILSIDSVNFKDYYNSYKEFKLDLDKTHISEVVLLVGFFVFIVTCIVGFIIKKRKSNEFSVQGS